MTNFFASILRLVNVTLILTLTVPSVRISTSTHCHASAVAAATSSVHNDLLSSCERESQLNIPSYVPFELVFEGDFSSHSGIAHANRALLEAALVTAQRSMLTKNRSCSTTNNKNASQISATQLRFFTSRTVEGGCSHLDIITNCRNGSSIVIVDTDFGKFQQQYCAEVYAKEIIQLYHRWNGISNESVLNFGDSHQNNGHDNEQVEQARIEKADSYGVQHMDPILTPRVTLRSHTWLPLMLPGILPSSKARPLPADGSRFILHFPWELDGLPATWSAAINTCVDEVWVPSQYVKNVLENAGVLKSDDIWVLPHAIVGTSHFKIMTQPQDDSALQHNGWEQAIPFDGSEDETEDAAFKNIPSRINWEQNINGTMSKFNLLNEKNGFVFLFVGGLLPRKGIDILLRSINIILSKQQELDNTCTTTDSNICKQDRRKSQPYTEVWIYVSYQPTKGNGAIYSKRILSEIKKIQRVSEKIRRPFIRIRLIQPSSNIATSNAGIEERMQKREGASISQMKALYARADCFVLPYRAEGFALTAYDAALAGTPTLLPDAHGLPTSDWFGKKSNENTKESKDAAFFVSAKRVPCHSLWPCNENLTMGGSVFSGAAGGKTQNSSTVWWHEVDAEELSRTMQHIATLDASYLGKIAANAKKMLQSHLHVDNISTRLSNRFAKIFANSSLPYVPRRWRKNNRDKCMGVNGNYYQLHYREIEKKSTKIKNEVIEKSDATCDAESSECANDIVPTLPLNNTSLSSPFLFYTSKQVSNSVFEAAWSLSQLGDSYKAFVTQLRVSEDSLHNTKKENIPKTMIDDTAKAVPVALCTFPNSGTSWLLNLVRHASGIFKHTVYQRECDSQISRGRRSCVNASQHLVTSPTSNHMGCMDQCNGIYKNDNTKFEVFAINETEDRNGIGRVAGQGDSILIKTHLLHYQHCAMKLKQNNSQQNKQNISDSKIILCNLPQQFYNETHQYINQWRLRLRQYLHKFEGVVHLIRNPIDNIVSRAIRLQQKKSARFEGKYESKYPLVSNSVLKMELDSWAAWHLALAEAVRNSINLTKRYKVLTFEDLIQNASAETSSIISFLNSLAVKNNSFLSSRQKREKASDVLWASKYNLRTREDKIDSNVLEAIPLYLTHLTPWQIMYAGERLQEFLDLLNTVIKSHATVANVKSADNAAKMNESLKIGQSPVYGVYASGSVANVKFQHFRNEEQFHPQYNASDMIAKEKLDSTTVSSRIARDVIGVNVPEFCEFSQPILKVASRDTTQVVPQFSGKATHFFIFCCAKAPRSALFHNIIQHPAVTAPRCIQPHFFDHYYKHYFYLIESEMSITNQEAALTDKYKLNLINHRMYSTYMNLASYRYMSHSQILHDQTQPESMANLPPFITGDGTMAFTSLATANTTFQTITGAGHSMKVFAIMQPATEVFAATWILPFQQHLHKGLVHSMSNQKIIDTALPSQIEAFERQTTKTYSCMNVFHFERSKLIRCIVAHLLTHANDHDSGKRADFYTQALEHLSLGLDSLSVRHCLQKSDSALARGVYLVWLLPWLRAAYDARVLDASGATTVRRILEHYDGKKTSNISFVQKQHGQEEEGEVALPIIQQCQNQSEKQYRCSLNRTFFLIQAAALFEQNAKYEPRRTNDRTMIDVFNFLEINVSGTISSNVAASFRRSTEAIDVRSITHFKTSEILAQVSQQFGRVFETCDLNEIKKFYAPFNAQLQEVMTSMNADDNEFLNRYWSHW